MSPEIHGAIISGTIANEGGKRDEEIAFREELATNYELLHDEKLEKFMEDLMYKPGVILNPTTGQYEVIRRADIDFDMAALRMIISHVNRASFISPEEAEVLKIKLRHIIRRIRMRMRPDTYNLGVANFLKAVEIYVLVMLSDAVGGRKAKLTKTIPKVMSIDVQSSETQRKKPEVM